MAALAGIGQRFGFRRGKIHISDVRQFGGGTLSPTLGQSIAMGFVASEFADEGSELEIDLRGKRVTARVVRLPFYKRPKPS